MSSPRLGYVVRFVSALGPAVAFYRDVLGQNCTKETEHWAQFDCDPIRLGLYERRTMAEALEVDEGALGAPPGGVELAFEVEDVDAAFAAAVAAGAPPFRDPADRAWGERTAYVLDPDGALVELYSRPRAGGARPADTTTHDRAEDARRAEMGSPSSTPTHAHSDPNAG